MGIVKFLYSTKLNDHYYLLAKMNFTGYTYYDYQSPEFNALKTLICMMLNAKMHFKILNIH